MGEIAALSGIRVIELAEGISGPYCGWLFACAGADVTKVEPPPDGDRLRHLEPKGPDGNSAAFDAINTGKRSVLPAPDLEPAVIESFLSSADVVICDGTSGRVGPWEAEWVSAHVGERAVVCRTTPLGSDLPATELEVQALSGLTRYLGAAGDQPLRIGADIGHILAGAFLFQAALAALFEREESGRGQVVETSALGSLAAVASVMVAAVDDPDEWEGFHCRAAAYSRDYGVRTATGSISFSAPRRDDNDWLRLCAELGADELAKNQEYAHDTGRTPRSKELNRELSEVTRALPRETVLEAAHRNNALAVSVQTYPEVFAHPQVAAIDAVFETDGKRRLAPPWRINGVRPAPRTAVPKVGLRHRSRPDGDSSADAP